MQIGMLFALDSREDMTDPFARAPHGVAEHDAVVLVDAVVQQDQFDLVHAALVDIARARGLHRRELARYAPKRLKWMNLLDI